MVIVNMFIKIIGVVTMYLLTREDQSYAPIGAKMGWPDLYILTWATSTFNKYININRLNDQTKTRNRCVIYLNDIQQNRTVSISTSKINF